MNKDRGLVVALMVVGALTVVITTVAASGGDEESYNIDKITMGTQR